MESAGIELSKQILLSFGIILAAGAFSGFFAQKIRVPDVVIFLLAGILLGPEAAGLLQIKADSALNQIVLVFGACYILFDGGASVRLKVFKEVWITIVALATIGVLIMTVITGIAAYALFDVPFIVALLLGSTIASTDPATLIPIFRQIRIRDRVSQTVISESAFNDATSAVITFSILAVAVGGSEVSSAGSLLNLIGQPMLGIIAGGVCGYLAALLIAHERYAFLAEYAPVVTLVAVIGAYLGADGLHASGFMAVFVFGIVLGNKESLGFRTTEREHKRLDEYIMTTAFIMRMFIFILLGSQMDFGLVNLHLAGGVVVVAVFMLIARPATVFLCTLPDRRAKWSFKEILFMCWTRETGVIPAALAGLLMGMKAPGSQMIVSVTFIAIMVTILIQASTTRWLAKKLDLLV